uniref:Uncharacterized protein n=1 Tax=Picea glauca TaxID=3330 RepID=A0A101LVU7_PICGL|nr:hypothetical protein ABT39_MTgene1899 [Picea glauca]
MSSLMTLCPRGRRRKVGGPYSTTFIAPKKKNTTSGLGGCLPGEYSSPFVPDLSLLTLRPRSHGMPPKHSKGDKVK